MYPGSFQRISPGMNVGFPSRTQIRITLGIHHWNLSGIIPASDLEVAMTVYQEIFSEISVSHFSGIFPESFPVNTAELIQ